MSWFLRRSHTRKLITSRVQLQYSLNTFSAVFLEIGPWNQDSRASRVACALAVSGSISAGEDADAVDDDAADDEVTVNGSEMLRFVVFN